MTDDVEILRITHHPDRKPPLRVAFRFAGRDYEVGVDAAQIQAFCAFQRLVGNRLGVWLRFREDARPQDAACAWHKMISHAFAAGRGGQ